MLILEPSVFPPLKLQNIINMINTGSPSLRAAAGVKKNKIENSQSSCW